MQLDNDRKPTQVGEFLRDVALVVGAALLTLAGIWTVSKLAFGLLLS